MPNEFDWLIGSPNNYINSGQTKQMAEYIFSPLYSHGSETKKKTQKLEVKEKIKKKKNMFTEIR